VGDFNYTGAPVAGQAFGRGYYMALFASGGLPVRKPTGSFPALCVEVIDAGWFEPHKNAERQEPVQKCKLRFYYEGDLAALDTDGEPVLDSNDEPEVEYGGFYADIFCTLSLGKKSILGPFLEEWRGKAFTDAERRKFDVQQLEGIPALINVVEGQTEGYYDVKSAMRVPKAMQNSVPQWPDGYERDRDSDEPMASRHPRPSLAKKKATAAPTPAPRPRPTPAPVPAATRKVASEERADAMPRTRKAAEPLPAALEDDEDDLPF
jgi:hypothetical protein